MSARHLRTADIARAVGVHPNTVRLYEEWGFLPPVPRGANHYRQFSQAHVDYMRLARLAIRCTWLGGDIRQTALSLIRQAVEGDLVGALQRAADLRSLVQREHEQAERAAAVVERWAHGGATSSGHSRLRIGQVAKCLSVSEDMLRNWERNGLLQVPRQAHNRYRVYGPAETDRLRVIRALRKARYSTMAILRMLSLLDSGGVQDVRQALDTPGPEEDAVYVTDRWLSTLAELRRATSDLYDLLGRMAAEGGS